MSASRCVLRTAKAMVLLTICTALSTASVVADSTRVREDLTATVRDLVNGQRLDTIPLAAFGCKFPYPLHVFEIEDKIVSHTRLRSRVGH